MSLLAGLYLRLSEKDKAEVESESIENQRRLLMAEAKKRGFQVVDCYVDDGFTGTNFHRPGFERMLQDIAQKRINIVMTKDLSRFGRNYAQAGYYQEEFFPRHRVRYLAVLDGYDSDNEYSTACAPWMNVANEQYAKDTSRKIRGALRAKMEAGQFIGAFAPYGYRKHPSNKHQLIIDEQSAWVVRRIFSLLLEGQLPGAIAALFNAENLPTPAQYRQQRQIKPCPLPGEWTASTVTKISRNLEYTGAIVHNRQSKVSYKSKAYLQNEKAQWIINEGAHEAIIPQETFEAVQRVKDARQRKAHTGFRNLLAGFAFCADCGRAMSASPTRKWQEGVYHLSCGAYKLHGTKLCTNHFIRYDHLQTIVYKEISQRVQGISPTDWAQICEAARQAAQEGEHALAQAAAQKKELACRMEEIDAIIRQLYEDRMKQRLSEARFEKLLQSYEEQQKQIEGQCKALEERAAAAAPWEAPLAERVRQAALPPALTREMLFAHVERILVHQGRYETIQGEKQKQQRIEIHLKHR